MEKMQRTKKMQQIEKMQWTDVTNGKDATNGKDEMNRNRKDAMNGKMQPNEWCNDILGLGILLIAHTSHSFPASERFKSLSWSVVNQPPTLPLSCTRRDQGLCTDSSPPLATRAQSASPLHWIWNIRNLRYNQKRTFYSWWDKLTGVRQNGFSKAKHNLNNIWNNRNLKQPKDFHTKQAGVCQLIGDKIDPLFYLCSETLDKRRFFENNFTRLVLTGEGKASTLKFFASAPSTYGALVAHTDWWDGWVLTFSKNCSLALIPVTQPQDFCFDRNIEKRRAMPRASLVHRPDCYWSTELSAAIVFSLSARCGTWIGSFAQDSFQTKSHSRHTVTGTNEDFCYSETNIQRGGWFCALKVFLENNVSKVLRKLKPLFLKALQAVRCYWSE